MLREGVKVAMREMGWNASEGQEEREVSREERL